MKKAIDVAVTLCICGVCIFGIYLIYTKGISYITAQPENITYAEVPAQEYEYHVTIDDMEGQTWSGMRPQAGAQKVYYTMRYTAIETGFDRLCHFYSNVDVPDVEITRE